jgi:LmbE family N-acetylglucosaminyl deacetylase
MAAMTRRSVLVVAAHPDDEVLGCGATIARERAEGSEVSILILATGATSRGTAAAPVSREAVDRLYEECAAANAALGVRREAIAFGQFPDQRLDVTPVAELKDRVRESIAACRPDVVFTHHPGDYNPDHRAVFEAVLWASRPCLGEVHPAELYAFEVLSSSEWSWQDRDGFRPSVYVDVAPFLEAKKEALRRYGSELRPYPHPRSVEGVEILAKKRGLEVSLTAAECFEVIRVIRR